MFRCNNQTQFNQKTQNCDWWYNVNCGGRLGSPSDFDQLPSSSPTESSSEQAAQQQSRQRQPDRETAASSNEEQLRTTSGSPASQQDSTGAIQLIASGSSEETTGAQNEQKAPDASRQDLSAAYKQEAAQSSRWSVTSPLKLADGNNQEEPDLFHHSESAANMTVAPDVARQQAAQQLQDQSNLQQQAQPTSSTPVYTRQGAGADAAQQSDPSRQEEFAERSSTTRDPLFGQAPSNELSFGAPVSTEQSSGSYSSASTAESRPQVGAILTSDTDQSLQSLVATQAAQENDRSNSSSSSFINTSSNDSAATTSTSTISDSTINNLQQQISSSQTTTSSMAPSTTSELLAAVADSGTTESGQSSNQTLVGDQANSNKSRRLVQSEFGLGVQQKQSTHREGGSAKSARSAARFEFVRNPSSAQASGDALFSGQLSAYPKSNGQGEQLAANHKYSSLASDVLDPSAFQIYSTSANQGSVSYMPLDEQSSLSSLTRNQDESANQQQPQKTAQIVTRKLNRRFGARLAANSPNEKRTSTNFRDSTSRAIASVSR